MKAAVTTGVVSRAKLQSNHHQQQTNIRFFYRPDARPVAQPTVSKHWREKYHIPWTCLPQAHPGSSNFVSDTSSLWLPWWRVAMPLISELHSNCQLKELASQGWRGLATLLPGDQEPSVVKNKELEYPASELGVSKSVACDTFFSLQCFDTVGWATGRASGPESWVLVCWWWTFDWSFARLIQAPVVTITSIILISNKIQNGDILVPAYPGCPRKCPLNECLSLYM